MFIPVAHPLQLTKYDYIEIALRRVVRTETLPTAGKMIESYKKPLRARHLKTRDELMDVILSKQQQNVKPELIGGSKRRVMDDWVT